MVASTQMKFASAARLRSVFPFGNTEPTCMSLAGHFMDSEGQVLVYQTEKYQLTNEICTYLIEPEKSGKITGP